MLEPWALPSQFEAQFIQSFEKERPKFHNKESQFETEVIDMLSERGKSIYVSFSSFSFKTEPQVLDKRRINL